MKTRFFQFFFLILFLVVTSTGCQRLELYHNLQEIEVNEILVVLQENGISALKEKEITGQDVSWKISVKESDAARARQILINSNLPRNRELGLSGVYKEKGLIPTPDEQKARFLLALKGEIINSLHKIPGVVDVDVVLNVPTENEFSGMDPVKKRPTASVIIRTRNEELVSQTVTEGKIQRFVANTVPNLDPNDVVVIISRADVGGNSMSPHIPAPLAPPSSVQPQPDDSFSPSPSISAGDTVELAGIRMDSDSLGRFKFYIIGLLSLLVGVSSFLLYNIFRLNRMRLKVQKGGRSQQSVLNQGQSAPLLGSQTGSGAMDGTFDVGTGTGTGQKQF